MNTDLRPGLSPDGLGLALPNLPKISIVTPNYNYGHFLEATLRSVVDQSYPGLEYIVIDGGSTDHSVDIIQRYETQLAYWRTGPDQGQYQAIAEGFRRATGEIFCWLNSDDMYMPSTLRAVGEIFAAFPQVEWISTLRPGHWDCTGLFVDVFRYPGFSREAFLDGHNLPGRKGARGGFIQQESTFWRRSLWERAGGYVSQDYGPAGDFDLWSRFYEHAELVGVNVPLAGFRLQHQQQMSDMARYLENCARALDDARKRAGWAGPQLARRFAYTANLRALPRVRVWAAKAVGYTGRRLSRANPAGPIPSWALESYRFL